MSGIRAKADLPPMTQEWATIAVPVYWRWWERPYVAIKVLLGAKWIYVTFNGKKSCCEPVAESRRG